MMSCTIICYNVLYDNILYYTIVEFQQPALLDPGDRAIALPLPSAVPGV